MNTQIIINHDDNTVLIAQTGGGADGDHRMVGPFEDVETAFSWVSKACAKDTPWLSLLRTYRVLPGVKNVIGSEYRPVDAPKRTKLPPSSDVPKQKGIDRKKRK